MLSPLELTGRTRSHVAQFEAPRFAAMPRAGEAFLDMSAAARRDGLEIEPVSAFRDFDTQLRIWNGKFRGERTLYDAAGRPRDHGALAGRDLVFAILEWSALPGASRHHWGTEIDVIDRAAMPPGYRVRLLPEETAPGGLFRPLHAWLDAHAARFGFVRPYATERGGMHPEPWHLSFVEAAGPCLAALTPGLVAEALSAAADLAGRDVVLDLLDEIFERHVRNVDEAAALRGRAPPVPTPSSSTG